MLALLLAAAVASTPPLPPDTKSAPKQPLKGAQTILRMAARKPAAIQLPTFAIEAVPPGFVINSLQISEGHVTITWSGGKPPYQVEQASAITGPWSDAGEMTTNTQITLPITSPQAFYRIEQEEIAPVSNWSTCFGNTPNFSDGAGASSARYDDNGNVIISGSFTGNNNFPGGVTLTNSGGQDIFIAKYSPEGALIWAKSFGNGSVNDTCNGSMVDGRGDLIISGSFSGTLNFGGQTLTSAETVSMYVAKYSTTSAAPVLQWVKQWQGAQIGTGVTIDSAYNIFITGGYGYYGGSVNFGGGALPAGHAGGYNVFVVKLDPSGNHFWSHGYGGATGYNTGLAIRTSYQGDPVVVGQFEAKTVNFGGPTFTNQGAKDIFIAKYNNVTGAHIWSKGIGGTNSDVANSVSVDVTGDVAVTGSFQSTVNFGDGPVNANTFYAVYLVVYDEGGNFKWKRIISPLYGGSGSSVTFDYLGSITVVGMATGLADYGNGWYVGGGTANCFIAKYLAFNGAYLSALVLGGAGNSGTFCSASSVRKDSVLATGTFAGSIDLGFGVMTSQGSSTGFLVKMP